MKKTLICMALALGASAAHAQLSATTGVQTSTASTAASQNSGQGNGNTIIQNSAPIPSSTSETIRNVSAGVLGAFASSVNAFDCHYTAAGANVAVAGVSLTAQGSGNDTDFCVKGWVQAELNRQSTITKDSTIAAKLQQASINVKCTLDDDVYRAMIAAGVECESKPKDYDQRNPVVVMNTDNQPVKALLVYAKAQP